MPAARYWRLVGVETYSGSDLELSELHLYGDSGRLDAATSLTCTASPISGTLGALQDDSLSTSCRFAAATVRAGGFAFAWDFGAGNTVIAIGLRLGSADAHETFMAGCTLQYSTDGAQWATFLSFNRYEYPGARTYMAPPLSGDTYFDKVSLLLHFDGADGSTVFTDKSTLSSPVTSYGNAKVSTAQSKWGGASLLLGGTGDYLSAPANDGYVFGIGDFTVEMWIKTTTTTEDVLVDQFSSGLETWQLSVKGGKLSWYRLSGYLLTGTKTLNDGVWHHVAVTREAGLLRLFVDGVLDGSVSDTMDYSRSITLGIGAQVSSRNTAYDYAGHIDDLRISKGICRYSSNFSVPDAPFSDRGGSTIAPILRVPQGIGALVGASAPVPAHSTPLAPSLQIARDVEIGGPGTIYGTTKTKGTPNTPTKARVVLLHQRSKLPLRETWSDPVTGYFEFAGIDTSQQFLTLAEDANGDYRPVAANRLNSQVLR